MTEMQIEGQSFNTFDDLKRSLKKGDNGGLWTIPKEGRMRVRFLDESPTAWFRHTQYWHEGQMWPKVAGEKIPSTARASTRFLAWALRTDRDDPMVIPLILPLTAAQAIINYWELAQDTSGSEKLWEREYILWRQGEGKNTEYTAMAQAPTAFDPSPYTDLESYGELLINERKRCEAKAHEDDDIEDDDDDDIEAAPLPTTAKGRGRQTHHDDQADDPYEPEPKAVKRRGKPEEPSAPAYTEDDLFPDGEYRTNYTVGELRHISVEWVDELWEIANDVWNLGMDPVRHSEADVIGGIIDSQAGSSHETGGDEDPSEMPDFESMTIRELRKAASERNIDPSRMKKAEIVKALVDSF